MKQVDKTIKQVNKTLKQANKTLKQVNKTLKQINKTLKEVNKTLKEVNKTYKQNMPKCHLEVLVYKKEKQKGRKILFCFGCFKSERRSGNTREE